MTTLVTAAEAAKILNVKTATLYAYVSRGVIQSVGEAGKRSRFRIDDVIRLGKQKSYGHQPKQSVRVALNWGLPVFESSITLVENGTLYYRGRDVSALSRTASLEEIAKLLWDCDTVDPFKTARAPDVPANWNSAVRQLRANPLAERCLRLFALAYTHERQGMEAGDKVRLWAEGASVVRLLTAAVLGCRPSIMPIHQQCAAAWKLDVEGREAIRSSLVVCADHELNVSSFTARCAASSGASVGAIVLAALAALSGPLHGGASDRVESLFDEIENSPSIPKAIKTIVERGGSFPGFGHRLYPAGDPRAIALFNAWSRDKTAALIASEVEAHLAKKPMLDFALVALRRRLGLPRGAAYGIFAIARAVGWLAHTFEQYDDKNLIRPRAQYTGPRPESGAQPGIKNARRVRFG